MQDFSGNFSPEPQPEDTVTILRTDYENLVRTAQNHSGLCRCLLNAQIEDMTVIQALNACLDSQPIQHPSTASNQHIYNANAPSFEPASYLNSSHNFNTSSFTTSSSSYIGRGARHGIYPFPPPRPLLGSQQRSDATDDSFEASSVDGEEASDTLDHTLSSLNLFQEPSFRSVQLLNIPEHATYADIAAVVRGGIVFELSIIRRTSTATVTFAETAAAAAYYTHVRNNYLYIKDKRIDIRRSDRLQNLHDHFAKRIANGATRNLVLRNCSPSHTEASIRKDLDHIHGLEVVAIDFCGGMCHISTNSVANAMYARTCMMSRLKYKGSRLEWDVDECAQPLDQVPVMPRHRAPFSVVPLRRSVYMRNRFQLLEAEE
ncbi:hypothetical protein V8C42DRAFT_356085 [Trichoderma barbatum]